MMKYLKLTAYFFLRPFLIKKSKGKSIYLTFDDGPRADNTPLILNILKESNIKATFFMIGADMEKHPNIVTNAIKEGHTIGYHSYTHVSLKKRRFKEIREDVSHMNRLAKQFNYPITLYRPPYGDLSLIGLLYYLLCGKKIIMWSLDSRDSFEDIHTVKNIVSPENVSSGEIILFHDDYEYVDDLLNTTLKKYMQSKLKCGTL